MTTIVMPNDVRLGLLEEEEDNMDFFFALDAYDNVSS